MVIVMKYFLFILILIIIPINIFALEIFVKNYILINMNDDWRLWKNK